MLPNQDVNISFMIPKALWHLCFALHFKKLPGTGHDQPGDLDGYMIQICLKRVHKWILKLQTFYPFGLNEGYGENNSCIDEEAVIHHFSEFRNKAGLSQITKK